MIRLCVTNKGIADSREFATCSNLIIVKRIDTSTAACQIVESGKSSDLFSLNTCRIMNGTVNRTSADLLLMLLLLRLERTADV